MTDKLKVVLTCGACPEQYDVFLGDLQIGYLRLRHGHFRADYPDVGGETVYEASPRGDGEFEDDERDYYLRHALKALSDRHANGAPLPREAPAIDYELQR